MRGIFLLCSIYSHTTVSTAASFCPYNRLICQSRDTHPSVTSHVSNRPVSCSSNIIFLDMRNEWISTVSVGRKSGTAAVEMMSKAVGAEDQMFTLPIAGGCFGPPPNTQSWPKHLRCVCRAQLLLGFTQKGDTLQALRLHCMIGGDGLKSALLIRTMVVIWTHTH